MSFEVNLDSVGFDAYSNPICADTSRIDTRNFHKAIFSPSSHPCKPMHKIAPMRANINGKAEVTVEWGGKEGPQVSGSISGGIKDDRGNKVEAKIEIENDKSGRATISAEHEEKT